MRDSCLAQSASNSARARVCVCVCVSGGEYESRFLGDSRASAYINI